MLTPLFRQVYLLIICFVTIFLFFQYSFTHPIVVKANYTFYENFANFQSNNWISLPDHPTPRLIQDDNNVYANFNELSNRIFSYIAKQDPNYNIVSVDLNFRGYGGAVSQGSGVVLSNIIPSTSQNPPIDYDMYSVAIWNISDKYYVVSPLCDNQGGCGLSIHSRAVMQLPINQWSNVSFEYSEHNLVVTVNQDSYTLTYGNEPLPNGLFIGNSVLATNPQNWKSFDIDNISIQYGDPLFVDSFPYYSQLDPLWKDVIYDSGEEWNNPGEGTIGRWGCAITSVSMLLKKYGMNMPDGSEPTPLILNTWLKNQPDGYVGGGLLNWLAITRLAHSSYLAGESPKELEFVKSSGSPSDELSSGYYPILNTGGHFVIAHKANALDYSINDPLSKLITTIPKTTKIKSVNTFIPSETNLSYILLVADPDIIITVPDSEYFDEALVDDGSSHTITKRLYYVRKPLPKTYNVVAQGEAGDQIEVYLYNRSGEVVDDNITLTSSDPTSFIITYDPNSTTNKIVVDPTPILLRIRSLRTFKSPFNGIMQALYSKFVDYFAYISQGVETSSYARDLLAYVNKQSPKHIPLDVKMLVQNYVRLIEAN